MDKNAKQLLMSMDRAYRDGQWLLSLSHGKPLEGYCLKCSRRQSLLGFNPIDKLIAGLALNDIEPNSFAIALGKHFNREVENIKELADLLHTECVTRKDLVEVLELL